MNKVSRPVFTRSGAIWLRLACFTTFFAGTVTGLAQKPARLADKPETALLNSLWDQGLAAGNFDDWYRNCDNWHASIRTDDYPQLNIFTGSSFQLGIVNAPRTVIGNASLGHNGMWGMTRFAGMTSSAANSLYNQYRANQHYAYPAVYDIRNNERDLIFAMYPYVTQSVGKSSSELDEIRKFVHTLAAFKPAVKTLLVDNGLLIPTLQMVWRRTRVADDAAYLSGEAHPSAFDNNPNNVAMIQLANAINTDDIPPMIQLSVVREDFGAAHATRFNEPNRTERHFTTPAAIARIHRGIEYTKRIVIDASGSFDINGRPLTWHFVPLRGAPGSVRINPLNPEGSLVEIEFDHQEERLVDWTIGQTSSLAVVGAFAHNGAYYSAPGFITSYSLWNETRVYDANQRILETSYLNRTINNEVSTLYAISMPKNWTKDVYDYDLNGRLFGWMRVAGSQQTQYSAEGMLIHGYDEYGRPATVGQVTYYNENNKSNVRPTYEASDWRSERAYIHVSQATPADVKLTHGFRSGLTAQDIAPPANGSLTITYNRSTGRYGYEYMPVAGFAGVDVFSLLVDDSSAQTGAVHRVRVVVGPADTTPPAPVPDVKVTGMTSDQAIISWKPTTDNVEVVSYRVYRDGVPIGQTFLNTRFEDNTVVPGETYSYTVTALDDAGNESPVSGAAVGGSAYLWGQDDFADGNYTQIDPNLINGLRWNVPVGKAAIATTGGIPCIRPGINHSTESMAVTDGSIAAPFVVQFWNHQQYVASKQGVMLLWQDPENFYLFAITRGVSEFGTGLYRVVDGEYTQLAQSSGLSMIHAGSNADFSIAVIHTGDAIAFQVTRSNWTEAPGAVVTEEFFDTDPAAVELFKAAGAVGFYQGTLSNWNVAYYGKIKISQLDGQGPDLDHDGLIDAWERLHFGSVDHPDAQPHLDPDGDGFDNLAEMQEGTNPTLPTSSPLRFVETNKLSDELKLSWRSFADQTYSVFYATSLAPANWAPLPGYGGIPATPPQNELQIASGSLPEGQAFFRVRLDP